MAQISLENKVDINGQYGDPASPIAFSSNTVTTNIIQGLSVTKAADKTNWVDGPLTYTVVVANESGSAMTTGTLQDSFNTTLVDFNTTYGVQIDGSATSNFTYNDGLLTITLPDLETDKQLTITFQVTRKT